MKDRHILRNRYLCLFDIIGCLIAFFMTAVMVNPISHTIRLMLCLLIPFIATTAVFLVIEAVFGIYRIMWRYCSISDAVKLAKACLLGFADCVLIFAGYALWCEIGFPGTVNVPGCIKFGILFGVLAAFAIICIRAMVFVFYRYMRYKSGKHEGDAKRLLIIGAGYSATLFIHDMIRNANLYYDIVGLIDDDESKKKCTISGYRVLGNRDSIVRICDAHRVDEILMAMPSAKASERKEIIDICNETGCKIKTLPSVDQMIVNGKFRMRDIEIDDLLDRDEIKLNSDEIVEYISGKTVMVTGGGGSIGSELCRQIMRFDPGKLIILDIYENNAYDIQMELNEKYPQNKPEVVIASIRDVERMEKIFELYKPEIVFHAAAHKHVPLMENSPAEAIKNNVVGTYNVAKCADKFKCLKFVMISTDKAVNPTNIMGASKRMCEMIVQAMQKVSKTEFVSVRFGNVLGSNGSVVPLFKRQIAKGGPVTITHKEITRFFMTIPEAAQLVMQAGAYAKGGEIFVLDMGKPVKVYDLAKNIIRLAGYKPGTDIEIKEVGLRPGEKLYEELMMKEEGLSSTKHSKIYIGHQVEVSIDEVEEKLKMLEDAADSQDNEKIREALHMAVPTFNEPEKVNNLAAAVN